MLVGPHFLAWSVEVGSQGCASQLKGGSAVMAVPTMGLPSMAVVPHVKCKLHGREGALGLLSVKSQPHTIAFFL